VTLVVMGAVAGTSFGDNFDADDVARAFPVWEEDGYLQRVARSQSPMDPAWVADAILYVVTRPRGMMMDVVHTRASG